MNKSKMKSLALGSTLIGVCTLGFALPAHAVLVDCPADFTTDGTAKVTVMETDQTAASACQYISPADNSNVANAANVNAAAFFGISTWEIAPGGADQTEPDEGGQGTWSVPGADFAAFSYMLTFKSGANTNLTSFLLNGEAAMGLWFTPFTDPPFNFSGNSTSHDVSHYSLFRSSGTTTRVPEPSALALLGTALLTISFVRRRRRPR